MPEVLLDKCARVASRPEAGEPGTGEGAGASGWASGSGEDAGPLDEGRRDAVDALVKRLAGRGLRVLAIAETSLGAETSQEAGHEAGGSADADDVAGLANDLTLLGFVAIADVMRPDAADVVRQLAEAGVRPVMITGDHPETATAIANSAAIPDADRPLTGGELGRALWRSVQDAVSILVGGNAGEVSFMVLGTALGGRSPLNTRQLLLVNMLTDMFPALAVAGTRPRGNGDDCAPVSSEPLLTGPLGKGIAIRGGATALGGTLAWAGGRVTGRPRRASTMGLAGVVGTQLAQTIVTGGFSPMLVVTSAASAAVLVAVVETPGISQFFGCTPLGPVGWGIVGASTATATAASIAAPRLLPLLKPASGGLADGVADLEG